MTQKTVFLKPEQEFITLQALLQITDVIPSGGMAKMYLSETPVLINGESENRRGRKLYPGNEIQVEKSLFVIKKP